MSQSRRKSKIPQRWSQAQPTRSRSTLPSSASQSNVPDYLRPVQPAVYHKSSCDYLPSSETSESHAMLQEKELSSQCEKAAQLVVAASTPTQESLKRAATEGLHSVSVSVGKRSEKRSSLSISSEADFSKDGITVTIHDWSIWKRFLEVGNEMIVTKPGRRMFPTLLITVRGLNEKCIYTIEVRTRPGDKNRYKYTKSRWIAVTVSEIDQKEDKQFYRHPSSPNSGSFWMKKPINFQPCKITHDIHSKNGHILIHTMHKYVLEIVIKNCTDKTETAITLPPTEFIAVTAYQNPALTSLKIENNPFAKGFRERQDDIKKEEIQTAIFMHCVPPSPMTPNSQFSGHFMPPQQQELFHQQLPAPRNLAVPMTPNNLITPPLTPATVPLPVRHQPRLPPFFSCPHPSSSIQSHSRGLISPPPFALPQEPLPPSNSSRPVYSTLASNPHNPAPSAEHILPSFLELFGPQLPPVAPMNSMSSSLAPPPLTMAPPPLTADQTQFPLSSQWYTQQQMTEEQYPLPAEASLKISETIDPTELLFEPVSIDDFPLSIPAQEPVQNPQQPSTSGLPPPLSTVGSVQASQYNNEDLSSYHHIW